MCPPSADRRPGRSSGRRRGRAARLIRARRRGRAPSGSSLDCGPCRRKAPTRPRPTPVIIQVKTSSRPGLGDRPAARMSAAMTSDDQLGRQGRSAPQSRRRGSPATNGGTTRARRGSPVRGLEWSTAQHGADQRRPQDERRRGQRGQTGLATRERSAAPARRPRQDGDRAISAEHAQREGDQRRQTTSARHTARASGDRCEACALDRVLAHWSSNAVHDADARPGPSPR